MMQNPLKLTILPLAILLATAGANVAAATPLTPFRYEAQAQRHCPGDTVVWLAIFPLTILLVAGGPLSEFRIPECWTCAPPASI